MERVQRDQTSSSVEQQRALLSVVQNGGLQLQWVLDQRRPAAVLEGNHRLTDSGSEPVNF